MRVLKRVCDRFRAVTGSTPRIGAEIEFYLDPSSPERLSSLIPDFLPALTEAHLSVGAIRQEVGPGQYEISLPPSDDPMHIAQDLERLKEIVSRVSAAHGCPATFAPRPNPMHPPSALHIHVSLIDSSGRNRYTKQPGIDDETESMRHSIAGLCELMNASTIFFAPSESSYARFRVPFTEGCYKFANAPSTISWGGDNRTVAIRIPTSTTNPESRHLEHRVPGSDADPALVIAAVLAGIAFGLEHRLSLTLDKVWSDAAQESGGVRLVQSLDKAIIQYLSCEELRLWMAA